LDYLEKKDYNYAITDSPPLSVIQQLKRFGTSFEIFMKEIQKSKQQIFKLKEVQLKIKEDENIATYFL
jgi:hypothetical protein